MTRVEIERFADAAVALLADPDAALTDAERLRWEGVVTALDVVLGRAPAVVDPAVGAMVRDIL